MITQYLIDMLVQIVAFPLYGLPPLPPDIADVLAHLQSAGAELGEVVARFSPIVPWTTFVSMVGIWGSLVLFWLLSIAIRFAKWLVSF